MSRYAIKFPFRVRIHGGEFDESARAIHRADGLKTIQAESGIVLESTIERKQMSTKTTFKRIALVTVAALGFGVMSVAPSQADNSILRFVSGDGQNATNPLATGNGVAGAFNYVTLQTVVPATDYVVTTDSTFATVTTGVVASDKKSFTATAAANPIQVMTPAVGTVTVSYWVRTNGVLAAAPAETVTITVRAAAQNAIPATATSYLVAGESGTAITDVVSAADATVNAAAAAALSALKSTAVASIKILVKDALGNTVNDSLTATVTSPTGAGSVSNDTNIGSTSATSAAGDTGGFHVFYVYSNGNAGTATITIKAGTTTLATESVVFAGKATKYVVAAGAATTSTGVNVPVLGTTTYTVTATDSAGNLVAPETVYGFSGTAANATVTTSASTASGVVTMTVTGVAAGTSVITFGNASTAATSTVTATTSVEVTKSTAKTVTLAFDKSSYEPGEKMVLTVTALDSNGKGVADGARALFAADIASNFGLTNGSNLTGSGTPTLLAGKKAFTIYAPATSGKFTVTATEGTATDNTTKVEVTASATVANPALTAAQEATDAANEATDAGNNAKDAADQAIEAADASTIAAQDAQAAAEAATAAAEQAGQDAVDAAAEATDAANNAADIAAQAIESADAATAAAEEAAAAATAAGEMAVEAAEAAGAIAQDALDAANAATDAALSAAEAADAATAAATDAKESADAATAAVAALSAEVAKLMAALNAKITTLSNLVAKIAKKVKA